MAKADFYTLKENSLQARNLFACRLCDKAVSQGMIVYIQTADEDTALEMDSLLWSFRPDSFIPHALVDEQAVAPAVGSRMMSRKMDNLLRGK